jgi:hypothetical protein
VSAWPAAGFITMSVREPGVMAGSVDAGTSGVVKSTAGNRE